MSEFDKIKQNMLNAQPEEVMHPKILVAVNTQKGNPELRPDEIELIFDDGSKEYYHKNDPEFLRMKFNLKEKE